MRPELHGRLSGPGHPGRDRRLDWKAAKTRVLSILMQRSRRGEAGLTNAEIRQITHLDRFQAEHLLGQLRKEHGVRVEGRGRGAVWLYGPADESEG